MVDAVGVEIFAHVLEALYPPLAAVGEHLVPVVGREAPVLSVGAECIGWRTGLAVHVEVVGLYPCVATVWADTDGNVALEDYMLAAGILVSGFHLLTELKLDEHPECRFLTNRCGWVFNALLECGSELTIVRPLFEVGGAELVAQNAECGIRHKPTLVGVIEFLVVITLYYLLAILSPHVAQVTEFELVDTLIIDLRKLVELLALLLVFTHFLNILECGKLLDINIHGVQSVNRDAVVRITVGPRLGDGGVVDWKHLQGTLACAFHPVDHLFEVTEVAHTTTLLTAQREDWNHCAGDAPCGQWECCLGQFVAHNFACGKARHLNASVVALFPAGTALVVDGDKLEDDTVGRKFRHVELDGPLVVSHLGHLKSALCAPVAQCGTLAAEHQMLVGCKLWSTHVDNCSPAVACAGQFALRSLSQAVGKRAAVEVAVLRKVEPMVVDDISLSLSTREHEAVRHCLPLVAHFLITAIHAVIVVDVSSTHSGIRNLANPTATIDSGHLVRSIKEVELAVVDVQHNFLSKDSLIIQIKDKFHNGIFLFSYFPVSKITTY